MSDQAALRPLLLDAARELNAGRYFEAHEVLEESLDAVPDELWPLFLGLIQVAVGYHKTQQGLLPGAERMLEIGLEKLAPFAPDVLGVAVGALRERARRDLERLRAGETVDLRDDPPRLLPAR